MCALSGREKEDLSKAEISCVGEGKREQTADEAQFRHIFPEEKKNTARPQEKALILGEAPGERTLTRSARHTS